MVGSVEEHPLPPYVDLKGLFLGVKNTTILHFMGLYTK